MTLKEYYGKKWWKEFRKSLTDDKNCTCQICGIKRWERYKRKDAWMKPRVFNIHHKHYNHLFKEQKDDVLILCQSCHKFCHDAEIMARTRGGIYKDVYDSILNKTLWKFEKYQQK